MKRPQEIELSREEGEALIERLETGAWSAEDHQVLAQVVRLYFWLLFMLQESKLSLKRFRIMLFGQSAKACKPKLPKLAPDSPEQNREEEPSAASQPSEPPVDPTRPDSVPGSGDDKRNVNLTILSPNGDTLFKLKSKLVIKKKTAATS